MNVCILNLDLKSAASCFFTVLTVHWCNFRRTAYLLGTTVTHISVDSTTVSQCSLTLLHASVCIWTLITVRKQRHFESAATCFFAVLKLSDFSDICLYLGLALVSAMVGCLLGILLLDCPWSLCLQFHFFLSTVSFLTVLKLHYLACGCVRILVRCNDRLTA